MTETVRNGDVEGLAARLQQLIDRQEIVELIDRLGLLLDEKRLDDAETVFTEDMVQELPGDLAPCVGLDAVKEYISRALAAYGPVQHYLTNPIITMDGADKAAVRANLIAIHRHKGDDTSAHFDGGCYYDFDIVRTADGWRFRRMNLNLVWSAGSPPPGWPNDMGD